jgi:CRP/FNR family transcriptional regulator, cyclic AMP receptor protein
MVEIKHLKKGDVLMKEGESSNSMYWVQAGTLRLFKKKGSGFIELGVVHSGEVVGEMSFLDNQPRSASVEALQPCDIVEIPRGKFDEFLAAQPSWMKSLVQTLVKRLRNTNNRVRELESASTVYTKDEHGRTTKMHEFLSTAELLKLSSALLLAASRNAERLADGVYKVKAGWVQFYGAQVFGVQLSKIQVYIDVLHEASIVRIERSADQVELHLLDLDRLEKFIYFSHEENSKTDDKQLPITEKGVTILQAVHEFGGIAEAPAGSETVVVNVEDVFQKAAAAKNQKIPFDMNSFSELVKCGFSQEVRASGTDKTAVFNVPRFQKLFPILSLRQRFDDLNAQKRDA